MTSDNDKSLSDGETFDGGAHHDDSSPKSLGDEATFTGGTGGGAPRSLGDEVTFGGGGGSPDDDLYDDGMEVVDLESRYKIEGTLGKGGMGEVLLATDTRLERKVAIKRILGTAARSKTAVNRFLTEAKSIAALNHPNIVQIYDYGRAADGPYLIMEYVEGNSLLDKCRQGPIPLEEAIDLTCQLCDGLAKAHAANIIHRDIKPANVLMTSDGIPKLTDFGLAKDDTADTGMTMVGAVLGTLDFMPPEQRKDAALTDSRSDLWSLAATLYQMVTGRSPKIIKFSDVPQALQSVLGKALEDEKEDRYQSALQLRDSLRECLSAEGPDLSLLDEGQCPSCGTKNASSRRFCRNPDCGASLEVPCLSCSTNIPMWEAVCGNCGAKQEGLLDERRDEMETLRLEAEQCVPEHKYAHAIDLAEALGGESDPRLQHLKGWSERFLEEVQQERGRELQRVSQLVGESLTHEQAHDYRSGIKTLQQVPEPVRDNEVPGQEETAAEVLSRLERKQGQVQSLENLIQRRIKNRQLNGLLPQVEQLLALVPERADALKLKDQLFARDVQLKKVREESFSEAMKAFNAQNYGACLASLQKIDSSLVDDEVMVLREQASESNERLNELDAQIVSALSTKQYDGLLETVDAYLFLQRTDEARQKLRDQLIARREKQAEQVASLIDQAKQLRGQCQFDDAVDKLSRIPEFLREDAGESLLSECGSLLYQRNTAMSALSKALSSGDYGKSLQQASPYNSCLERDPSLQDSEFTTLYQQCQQGLQQQEEAHTAAERQRAKLNQLRAVGAIAAVFLVVLVAGLWAFSAWQASKLATAVERQRWDEVLSIDADNVAALIGRANQSLAAANPDLDSVLADVERAESLNPGLRGVDEIKGKVYALQAVEASEAGDVGTGETKLREAEELNVDAAYLDRANKSLALAYAKRAESAVASGNVNAAITEASKAMSFDPEVEISETVSIAAAESRASELVGNYKQEPTQVNLDEAMSSLSDLEKLAPDSSELTTLRSTLQMMAESQAESDAEKLVAAYEQDPTDTNLSNAVLAINTAGDLASNPNKVRLRTLRSRIGTVLMRSIQAFETNRSDENLQSAMKASSQIESLLKDSSIVANANDRIVKALVTRLGEIPLDQAIDEIDLLQVLNADRNARTSANRLIGSQLVKRFRDSLGKSDYKSAGKDFAAIANLDADAAKQLSSDWLKIPKQDYGSIPPSVLSKLPPVRNSIGMELKLIPLGTFTMGDGSDAHQVTLTKPFMLGVHEVTQEQYERVMGSNPSHFKGPQNPVEQVSWDDAMEFCQKLSALPEERAAGRVYRLPTEAEWEYACRAGTTTEYSFGDDDSDLGDYAWYEENAGRTTHQVGPHQVGQKRPNAWGLYDMHGNVWEWCADWHGDYPSGELTDPTGPQSGSHRVGRGGSWGHDAEDCRSAHRSRSRPSTGDSSMGFRVTCVPSGQ